MSKYDVLCEPCFIPVLNFRNFDLLRQVEGINVNYRDWHVTVIFLVSTKFQIGLKVCLLFQHLDLIIVSQHSVSCRPSSLTRVSNLNAPDNSNGGQTVGHAVQSNSPFNRTRRSVVRTINNIGTFPRAVVRN